MAGLLGGILGPSPQGGLLSLAMNLAEAGGRGAPTMGGIASSVRATQDQARAQQQYDQQQQQYQRQLRLQELQDKAIENITDPELREYAQIIGPEGLAQVLAAKMRSRFSEDPSNVREWQYYQTLSPEQQQQYLAMKRAAQYQDLGGYVAPVVPTTGGLGAPIPKTLPPQDQPSVRGAQAEAAAIGGGRGTTQATNEANAPKAMQSADQAIGTLNQLVNHPGFPTLYGWSGAFGAAERIPASDAAGAAALLQQVQSQAFLSAFETLKGAGQITEMEGKTATAALTRLGNRNVKDTEALQAAKELLGVAMALKQRAIRNMQAPQGAMSPAPSAAPSLPSADAIRAERERRAAMRGGK